MSSASTASPLVPGQPYQSRDGRHHVILSVRDDEQTGAPLFFLRDERTGQPRVETEPPAFLTQESRPLYP